MAVQVCKLHLRQKLSISIKPSFAFLMWRLCYQKISQFPTKNFGATYCCFFIYFIRFFSKCRRKSIQFVLFQEFGLFSIDINKLNNFFFLLVLISFISSGFKFLFSFFLVSITPWQNLNPSVIMFMQLCGTFPKQNEQEKNPCLSSISSGIKA